MFRTAQLLALELSSEEAQAPYISSLPLSTFFGLIFLFALLRVTIP